VKEKKDNLIQSLNLMLNSGKKFRALRDKKKEIFLTLMLSKKKNLNETKNHNSPCKINGRSLRNNRQNTKKESSLRLDILQ
jgi:hypothetical protein